MVNKKTFTFTLHDFMNIFLSILFTINGVFNTNFALKNRYGKSPLFSPGILHQILLDQSGKGTRIDFSLIWLNDPLDRA